MLIYVDSEESRLEMEKMYDTKLGLYCVYDTKNKYFNSPLWFEMYRPDEEVINYNALKRETNAHS